MKIRTRTLAAVMLTALAVAMLGGCVYINGDGLVGNGQMVTKERDLERDITGVVNRTSFDIVIDPDIEGKAVIEGESNLIDLVELEQDGEGVLTVDVTPGTIIMSLKRMTVRIPAINGGVIHTEGSGNITLKSGTLEGESFDVGINGSGDVRISVNTKGLEVSVNGSGDMKIEAVADTLSADIGGSGNISVSGSAGRLSLSIGGSGTFNGFGLAAGDADVRIGGSGDANVSVSGRLTGSVGGSGDLVYSGNPESVSVDDNAGGDVYKR